MPGKGLFLRRRHVSAAAVELFGSSRLGWRVFGVLGPLEAEMAGDLLSEGAVLGSQAGDLSAGGIELLAERVGGCALRGKSAGDRRVKHPLAADEVADPAIPRARAVPVSPGD
jgi:hypothetical protein